MLSSIMSVPSKHANLASGPPGKRQSRGWPSGLRNQICQRPQDTGECMWEKSALWGVGGTCYYNTWKLSRGEGREIKFLLFFSSHVNRAAFSPIGIEPMPFLRFKSLVYLLINRSTQNCLYSTVCVLSTLTGNPNASWFQWIKNGTNKRSKAI